MIDRLPVLLLAVPLFACVAHDPAPAPVVRGPLATRNQHPVALTFLHHRPRRPVTQPEGTWGAAFELSHSSIHEIDKAPRQTVAFDGETTRLSGRVRYGLGEATDVEVELAGIYASGGFLDGFISDFHSVLGFPQAGRDQVAEDQYDMRLRRNGQLIYELEEDRVLLGDVPVVVTHRLRAEDPQGPAVAVRAGVELPLGSERRGVGNGELDFGLGVLAERSLGRWTLTGALDLLLPGEPDPWTAAGVDAREIISFQAGLEYRWSDAASLLAQTFWTSPMTRDYDLEEFSREIFDFAVGVAWDTPSGARCSLAIKEDVVAATGPDFGVFFGVDWGF